MLSKEMREILVKAFNEIHDADKVAEIFNVSRRTVYTYVEKPERAKAWRFEPQKEAGRLN